MPRSPRSYVVEDHALRHSWHHLARIRYCLGSLTSDTGCLTPPGADVAWPSNLLSGTRTWDFVIITERQLEVT